ncbi:MAG TPA: universal stress protein [Actinomycetota bacterium]
MTEGEQLLRRVLVGTDGSARAEEAVRQGARLTAVTGGALEVVYVLDTGRAHDEDVRREAEEALARASSLAAEAGSEADVRIVAGDPAEALVTEAEEAGVDLVCLGPDTGLLGGAIRIGHVAAHVMRNAVWSVLLARRSEVPGFPAQILCGVDGSEASVETAMLAARIASASGARLRLLHVIPVFRGGDTEWTLDEDEASPPELEPSVVAASSRGVVPLREMAMGRPEHAIVASAAREETDLLVVGHRGVKGVRRVLLGSVSEYCAVHAPCSVLVARPASRP